jgi:hypothetical protein
MPGDAGWANGNSFEALSADGGKRKSSALARFFTAGAVMHPVPCLIGE